MFRKSVRWHKIYPSAAAVRNRLPVGKMEQVEAGGRKLCVIHHQDGFYVVDDKCPHQGVSLSKGRCNEQGEVICPWHHYRFDIATGRNVSGEGEYVDTYPLNIRDDGVYVGISRLSWRLFG